MQPQKAEMRQLCDEIEAVARRVDAGESLVSIGAAYGVTCTSVRRALVRHWGPERYRRAAAANWQRSHKGNRELVYDDLDRIEQRFRGGENLKAILADYPVTAMTLKAALLTRMGLDEYRGVTRRNKKAHLQQRRLPPRKRDPLPAPVVAEQIVAAVERLRSRLTGWMCAACGVEAAAGQQRCDKCGSESFEPCCAAAVETMETADDAD